MISIVILVVLSCIGAVSANDDNNDSTETLANEFENSFDMDNLQATENEDLLSDDVKPFSELQTLIDNSNDGDILNISGTYKRIGDENNIIIRKAVTIQGEYNNTLLDGSSNGAIFVVYSKGVVLNGLTFKNAKAYDGGAVVSRYEVDDLIILNCIFEDNYASQHGAGVYLYGGLVKNCIFINNIANHGGAITTSTVGGHQGNIITDCKFINNKARMNFGGGAVYRGDVYNSYFENNQASAGRDISSGSCYNCTFADYSSTSLCDCMVYDISITQSGSYYQSKTIKVNISATLVNQPMTGNYITRNMSISNAWVTLKFSNGKTVNVKTNSEGIATYDVGLYPGTYSVVASYNNMGQTLKNIKINNAPAIMASSKLTTTYASGKEFTVKVVDSNTKKAISGAKVLLKVYTGKKYKNVYITTDSKGIARYNTGKLDLGKHKIVASSALAIKAKTITSQVTINKAKRTIVAPATTVAYNKAGKFSMTVKHGESKKPLKGVTLKLKVYTGKKYKTYSIKTNKNGAASISTKKLSKGTHKVSIEIKANSKYKSSSKTSKIIVKKNYKPKDDNKNDNLLKLPVDTYIRTGVIRSFIYVTGIYAGFTDTYTVVDANGNVLKDKTISIYVNDKFSHNITSGQSTSIYASQTATVKLVYYGDLQYNGYTLIIKP